MAIHQPNLFPWLGFFHKMSVVDAFVLLDNVPFNRRGYQHRVQIADPPGSRWLTLPVRKKGRYGERTDQVQLDETRDWRREHEGSLRHAYAKTPGFDRWFPDVVELYRAPAERLVEFTVPGIRWLMGGLGIGTEILIASDLVTGDLRSSELLAALTLAAEGDVYVSGPSGRDYLDDEVFARQGVGLEFTSFDPEPYPQTRQTEFVPSLSSVDLLFNAPDGSPGWPPRGSR
ncbi:MAG TPA: WbqC family protein [Actinomycetota bacterium]